MNKPRYKTYLVEKRTVYGWSIVCRVTDYEKAVRLAHDALNEEVHASRILGGVKDCFVLQIRNLPA